jgi:hypothetical protein
VKQLKSTRLNKIFLLKATLLAAMLVPAAGVPAYGQQEVDPTWYDPWAAQTKVVVQPAQRRASDHNPQQKVSSVTHSWQARKPRVKRSVSTEASRTKNEERTTERNRF